MLTLINRSLSILVYFAYIATGFTHGGGSIALKLARSPSADGLRLVSRGSGQLRRHDSDSAYNCIYACIFSLCWRLASLDRSTCHCLRSFWWHMKRSNQSLQITAGRPDG